MKIPNVIKFILIMRLRKEIRSLRKELPKTLENFEQLEKLSKLEYTIMGLL